MLGSVACLPLTDVQPAAISAALLAVVVGEADCPAVLLVDNTGLTHLCFGLFFSFVVSLFTFALAVSFTLGAGFVSFEALWLALPCPTPVLWRLVSGG